MTEEERIKLMTELCACLISAKPDEFLNESGWLNRYKDGDTWIYPLIENADSILFQIERMAKQLERFEKEEEGKA